MKKRYLLNREEILKDFKTMSEFLTYNDFCSSNSRYWYVPFHDKNKVYKKLKGTKYIRHKPIVYYRMNTEKILKDFDTIYLFCDAYNINYTYAYRNGEFKDDTKMFKNVPEKYITPIII